MKESILTHTTYEGVTEAQITYEGITKRTRLRITYEEVTEAQSVYEGVT